MKTNQGLQDAFVPSYEVAGYLAELGQKAGLKCSEIEAGLAQGAAELWAKRVSFDSELTSN